jgi:serine protease Do
VADVTEGGAADQAGIKKNYIIKKFDGKDINTIDRLVELLEYYEPGEEVEVVVEVPNEGEYVEKTVTVTLGEDTSSNSDSNKNSGKSSKNSESDNDLEEYFFGDDFESDDQDIEDGQTEESHSFWN